MSDEETGGTIADGDRCDRDKMYATFQSWALQNYGDSGKTKTLTVRKYERVVNILTGDESMSADNSKFRFWVKAKGFRLGVPTDPADGPRDGRRVLYVPYKNSVRRFSLTTMMVVMLTLAITSTMTMMMTAMMILMMMEVIMMMTTLLFFFVVVVIVVVIIIFTQMHILISRM